MYHGADLVLLLSSSLRVV